MIEASTPNTEIFDGDVPRAFQRDLVRLLCTLPKISHDRCFGMRAYPEAHYLWPHERRADIEGAARELATKYDLRAKPQPFEQNGDFYSLIETEHVLCTICHVDERGKLPRGAKSRETMAFDQQMTMFGEAPVPPGTKLYTIIAYGGFSEEFAAPTFIDALFPSRNYTRILDRIPLLQRFMDELGGNGAGIENIPDIGGPTIRTQPKTDA